MFYAVSERDVVPGADRSVWARARAGDRHALATLVQRYQQPLAGYLWALGVGRESLEPLLIDTFVAAYHSPPGEAPLRVVLYGLATRLAVRQGVPEDRCLLVLHYLEAFSYAQAARMLGLSPAAVRARVRRAKNAFG